MTAPNVVFAGTPEFALASLEALVDAGFRPVAVLTQPDRKAGRGRKLRPGPVKQYAESHGLPLMQPATLREPAAVKALAALDADVFVVAAYGLLLPQAVLDLPAHGCVNVHASLLPRWRGAAPVQAAILAGDRETGVSLMRMEAGLDTGPVYVQRAVAIGADTTAGELHDELARVGAALLIESLGSILSGDLTPVTQDDSRATYAGKVGPDDARLDWRRTAVELGRAVRAYNPVPGARFGFAGEQIKCFRARCGDATAEPAGKVLGAGPDGVEVACGEGSLILETLQRPGRKPVSAAEFAAQLDLADARFE